MSSSRANSKTCTLEITVTSPYKVLESNTTSKKKEVISKAEYYYAEIMIYRDQSKDVTTTSYSVTTPLYSSKAKFMDEFRLSIDKKVLINALIRVNSYAYNSSYLDLVTPLKKQNRSVVRSVSFRPPSVDEPWQIHDVFHNVAFGAPLTMSVELVLSPPRPRVVQFVDVAGDRGGVSRAYSSWTVVNYEEDGKERKSRRGGSLCSCKVEDVEASVHVIRSSK